MSQISVSPAGMRIIKLLVGTPPCTVSELIRTVGVTRTAVAEQLDELVAGGFVERTIERLPGRGRPRHLYRATNAALALLAVNYHRMVVPAIWRAVHEIGGDEMLRKILKSVSRDLAQRYVSQITATQPKERLRQLLELLAAEGALLEITEDPDGHLVLHKRSCPFINMIDQRRSVCTIDQEFLSEVVGRRVRQTACRHDGAPCCTFEFSGKNGSE
jgi:DeoR family transcriptional regulator, suf operon transcriptional repressor